MRRGRDSCHRLQARLGATRAAAFLMPSMNKQSQYFIVGLVVAASTACGNDQTSSAKPDASPSADSPRPSGDAPSGTANIKLTTDSLGSRLVDADGKTLYFFANDLARANASTYSGAAWPAFDVQSPVVDTGLSAGDFGRFDRGGGVYQTTWKGRPLYYYANDSSSAPTAGEGLGGRWFVARDYSLFFGANSGITPKGGTAANGPFLTDAAGRTLYVYGADTRGTNGHAPTSACGAGCLSAWPVFSMPSGTAVLPSTLQAANVTTFTNGGAQQAVYKGWPLYYFASDTAAGQVAGASIPSWYPVAGAWDATL
jgi:predicted lipoprotein with Yx(FWY)xxD motif